MLKDTYPSEILPIFKVTFSPSHRYIFIMASQRHPSYRKVIKFNK